MLDHLRQKAAQTLASVDSVMLSSFGQADLQISRVASESNDLTLYVFVPRSSDHLLNLESRREVVVAGDNWELQGIGRVLANCEIPTADPLSGCSPNPNVCVSAGNQAWGCVVEIRPTRLTFHSPSGQGNIETIDFPPLKGIEENE